LIIISNLLYKKNYPYKTIKKIKIIQKNSDDTHPICFKKKK